MYATVLSVHCPQIDPWPLGQRPNTSFLFGEIRRAEIYRFISENGLAIFLRLIVNPRHLRKHSWSAQNDSQLGNRCVLHDWLWIIRNKSELQTDFIRRSRCLSAYFVLTWRASLQVKVLKSMIRPLIGLS